MSLAPATLPADTIGVAYDQTITASGGTGTLTLAVSNIQGPIAGLTVPASGTGSLVVSGTPTAAGTETFTLTATDSLGTERSTNYSLTVNAAPSLAPATLPADTIGVAYNQTITASGGTGTLTLAVSNIQGPIAGLTVPASGTGSLVVSGTPTAAGTETFTVTATDALGATTSDQLQPYGKRGAKPRSGDAAGRHDRRGLQPDDHRQRRHRHGHLGREQHSGPNRRPDRSGQRHGKPGQSAARPRPPGPRRSPSPPPTRWAQRRPPITALR